jgi:hypothetical protein
MSDADYTAAVWDPEEEEQNRLLRAANGDYAPVTPPADASAAPTPAPAVAAPPSPDVSSLPATSNRPYMGPSLGAEPRAPRPSWSDYAPPEPHGWAKVGHALASLQPGLNSYFNEMPQERAANRYKAALEEYQAPEKEAYQASETERNNAQAAKDRQPQPKTLTPDEQTYNSLLQTINPDTKKPYTPFEAHQKMVSGTAEAKKPPVNDVAGINQRLTARYQVLNPGQPLPAQFTLKPGANEDDYKQIDSDLQKVEQAQGTKAQQDAINEMRRQFLAGTAEQRTFEQNRQTENDKEKKQAAEEKVTEPIEGAINFAETYQQSVHTGPGDEALMEKYFELAKPSSGFRMTQNQMDMLQHARSWMEGTKAMAYHALTGRWFSDEQRNQIIDTMHQLADAKKAALGEPGTAKPQTAAGGKTLPMATIEKAAKDHKISVDEARKQAEKQGYTIQ